MACVFCAIVAGKLEGVTVWEDRDFLLMLDIKPIAPGHVLLLPKKHAEDVFRMPEREYVRLFRTAGEIAPILRRLTRAKRIGMVVEGFGVPHVHVHLVPVNRPGELNPALAKEASGSRLRALQRKFLPAFKRLG